MVRGCARMWHEGFSLGGTMRFVAAFVCAVIVMHGSIPSPLAGGVQLLSSESERALSPGDVVKDCENCPEMVVVPAGSFMMGSPESEKYRGTDEGPQHAVTIAKPFAVGRFAVTVDQFAMFVNETRYSPGL